jgi:hypothetical protein
MEVEERRRLIRQNRHELLGSSARDFSAGPGRGAPCSVCGNAIEPGDTEFAFPRGVRLDGACFKVWLEELGLR